MVARCTIEAPYPDPEPGYKRVIFALDRTKSPEAEILTKRVQLMPGRTITMTKKESTSIRGFEGIIKQYTVDGWGYNYYHVELAPNPISDTVDTNMQGGDEVIRRFVPITTPALLRYASEMPMVVYLPEDAELRYSIWSAGEEVVAEEM